MKNKRLVQFFLVFFLLLSAASASAETLVKGFASRVKDGDTVVIAPSDGGQFFTCRLYGIDAPEIQHGSELGQPYGIEAAGYLKKLVLGKELGVILTGGKTYNREVCVLREKKT